MLHVSCILPKLFDIVVSDYARTAWNWNRTYITTTDKAKQWIWLSLGQLISLLFSIPWFPSWQAVCSRNASFLSATLLSVIFESPLNLSVYMHRILQVIITLFLSSLRTKVLKCADQYISTTRQMLTWAGIKTLDLLITGNICIPFNHYLLHRF